LPPVLTIEFFGAVGVGVGGTPFFVTEGDGADEGLFVDTLVIGEGVAIEEELLGVAEASKSR